MSNSTVSSTSEENVYQVGRMTLLDICMYSINFLFGVPLHFYILWLIVKGSGVASEIIRMNLCVCEIGIGLNSLLSVISSMLELSCLTELVCFLLGLLVTARPLFQCLMCVERYLAVVHPVIFLKTKPLRYRVICCALTWIVVLGSCLCCMLILTQSKFYIYIYFCSIQFLNFFFIQMFCLVSVLKALNQSGPGERRRDRDEENHMKRRAFLLILVITITMSITYVPFTIAGFVFIFTKLFIEYLFSFGLLCFVLAGFVQPVLHLHCVGKLSFIKC